MEERRTVFDYLARVFGMFGGMVALMSVFCLLFGESAKGISTMFALGGQGIAVGTLGQYFLVSVLTELLRIAFFTDIFVKDKPIVFRTAGMVGCEIIVIVCFICMFGWFPVNMWRPWVMFFLCFLLCFAVSTAVTAWRERAENRRMETALQELKEKGKREGRNNGEAKGEADDGKEAGACRKDVWR